MSAPKPTTAVPVASVRLTADVRATDMPARAPWERPTLRRLPRLTELTLVTGARIHGGGSSGGTVF